MRERKKNLLVGPLNSAGVGGRLEEMKVWANALRLADSDVMVFSMFNANAYFGDIPVLESIDILTPISFNRTIRKFFLRIWASKLFKKRRDNFYRSKSWNSFLGKFDHITLFITDSSRERQIFESSSTSSIAIRFTGTIVDFTNLQRDQILHNKSNRKYIFHAPDLLFDFKPFIPTYFVDQTALSEKELLHIPISSTIGTFAMIGLFMEVKRVEEVIMKFKQFPQLKLLIFGKGELEAAYRTLINQNNLKNVEIRGFYPASNMAQMYSEFDGLIINSSGETGPMTGVEAMAAGKIVLSKRIGAMEGRLNDEKLMIDNTNPLENAIHSLLHANGREIFEIKTRLRNRYLENYSNEIISWKISQVTLN